MAQDTQAFKCPICNTPFVYSGHFNAHLRTHRITLADAKGCASVEELEAACRVSDSSRMPWAQ